MVLLQRPHLKWRLGGSHSLYTCSGGALSDRGYRTFCPSDMLCIQGLTCDIINGCDGGDNCWQLSPRGAQ